MNLIYFICSWPHITYISTFTYKAKCFSLQSFQISQMRVNKFCWHSVFVGFVPIIVFIGMGAFLHYLLAYANKCYLRNTHNFENWRWSRFMGERSRTERSICIYANKWNAYKMMRVYSITNQDISLQICILARLKNEWLHFDLLQFTYGMRNKENWGRDKDETEKM